jgi:hypothetical protein
MDQLGSSRKGLTRMVSVTLNANVHGRNRFYLVEPIEVGQFVR